MFVNAPFDKLVHAGTRFWDASAVQVAMAAAGPRLQFQSVPALFEGAVDFMTPPGSGAPARAGAQFRLYHGRDAAKHAPDGRAVAYRVVFHAGEAGGLTQGAAVTLEDKRVGTVTHSTLQYDPASGRLDTVATLAIEPSDIALAGAQWAADARPQMNALLARLIGEGLRARLGSAIPVVGGKTVELAFVPAPAKASLGGGDVPEIPTGPASDVSGIIASVNAVTAKLNAMPIDRIAQEVHQATQHIAALTASPQLHGHVAPSGCIDGQCGGGDAPGAHSGGADPAGAAGRGAAGAVRGGRHTRAGEHQHGVGHATGNNGTGEYAV